MNCDLEGVSVLLSVMIVGKRSFCGLKSLHVWVLGVAVAMSGGYIVETCLNHLYLDGGHRGCVSGSVDQFHVTLWWAYYMFYISSARNLTC